MALSSLFVKNGILSSSKILVENTTCKNEQYEIAQVKKGQRELRALPTKFLLTR